MSKPVNAIPFPRWPLVVIAVAVLAVAGVLVFTRGSGDDATTGTKIQKTTTSKPASGCLGGPDPAVAVLAAQKDAPRTADGAAAFLATYIRWQARDPRTDEPDPAAIGKKVWGQDVPDDAKADAVKRTAAQGYHATVAGKHYSIREVRGNRVLIAMTVDIADAAGTPGANSAFFGWVRLSKSGWVFDGYDPDLGRQAAGDDKGAAFRAKLDAEGIPFQEAC